MKLSSLWQRGADCTSAMAKTNFKRTKNQYKKTKKTIPKKTKHTSFLALLYLGPWATAIPRVQENWFFVLFWYWLFCFFSYWCFWYLFFCYHFVAIQVLTQSTPLLQKLDNVVHEDEYLVPEVFGHVSRIVYGGIASRSTNGRN